MHLGLDGIHVRRSLLQDVDSFLFISQSGFHHFHPAPRQGQTKEEYEENLRKSREEQIAAHERREREAIARKEKAAKERERGNLYRSTLCVVVNEP